MALEIKRISAPQAVVNYFKEQIEAGTLKPGDKLPSERILQNSLDISRFSLREGLARLSALGILRIVHGKGAFVTEEFSQSSLRGVLLPLFSGNDHKAIDDLMEARIVIEREVATLAAYRRTANDLVELEKILHEGEKALANPEDFGVLDHKFHRMIATVSQNGFFEKMLDVINDSMVSFLKDHAKSKKSRMAAQESHRQIVECLRKSDTNSVGDLIEKHIVGCTKNRLGRIHTNSGTNQKKSPVLAREKQ